MDEVHYVKIVMFAVKRVNGQFSNSQKAIERFLYARMVESGA
jgi:hypothetical protein